MNDGSAPVRRVRTHGSAELPALGLGTYRMGEVRADRANEECIFMLMGEHYDRHEFLDEKREALEKWNAHILGLVGIHR